MIELPGYQILRELGRGGMARVYLALHEGLERQVAIKVMHPKLSADRAFSERFLREARIVAKLSHPNIITIFDVNSSAGKYYLAMEYMPGESLGDKIKAGIGPGKALSILKQISMGLKFAHDKGFIHRDIKPANILFTEDDSAVITDFGVARAQASVTMMTKVGTIIGTPRYMSPEQAQGMELKPNADIYSLGVVFYEMLTGLTPYRADTPVGMMYQHVNAPVPELTAQLSFLQALLDKLLAKKAGDRYQSAGDIIRDIEVIGVIEDSMDTEFVTRVIVRKDVADGLAGETTMPGQDSGDEPTREVTKQRKVIVAESSVETILRDDSVEEETREVTIRRKSLVVESRDAEIALETASDNDETREVTRLRKYFTTESRREETVAPLDLVAEQTGKISLLSGDDGGELPGENGMLQKDVRNEPVNEAVKFNRFYSDEPASQSDLPTKNNDRAPVLEIMHEGLPTPPAVTRAFAQKPVFIISLFMLVAVASTAIYIRSAVTQQKLRETVQRKDTEHLVEQSRIEEERLRYADMIRQNEMGKPLAAEKDRQEHAPAAAGMARAEQERLALLLREKVTRAQKTAQQISLLNSKARAALEKDALPDAIELFQHVLALDVNNKVALRGIDQIAERYLALAEQEAEKINFAKADDLVHRAMNVSPNHPRLATTQQIIFDLKSKPVAKKDEPQTQAVTTEITPPAETPSSAEKQSATQRSFGGF